VSRGHFSNPIGLLGWIDGEKYRINNGFRFYLTHDEQGEFVDVPDGFVTNFASTPRLLWPFLPPTGGYAQIAVVHDKLFLAPVIRTPLSARASNREEANEIFLDGSEVLGVSWFVRKLMFRMLQAFSGAAWDGYRAADRNPDIVTVATPIKLREFEAAKVRERMAP
jgi:hypothetical protein